MWLLAWLEIGLIGPYVAFTFFEVRWRFAVRGSLHRHHAAVVCRATVFPGWAWPLVSAAANLVGFLSGQLWGGRVIGPLLVLIMALCFLSYTRSAHRFLADDDWWSGLGDRLRRTVLHSQAELS